MNQTSRDRPAIGGLQANDRIGRRLARQLAAFFVAFGFLLGLALLLARSMSFGHKLDSVQVHDRFRRAGGMFRWGPSRSVPQRQEAAIARRQQRIWRRTALTSKFEMQSALPMSEMPRSGSGRSAHS